MWCSTPYQQHLIDTTPFDLQGAVIVPSKTVRILGIMFYSDLTMSTAVSHTVSTCFHQLRRLRLVRKSLPITAAKVLVNSIVISRVDYCNGVFSGCALHQLNLLHSILGASARILYGGSRYQHVTPLLRDKLHWLRFKERVKYKLCITVYNGMNQRALTYIRWCRSPVGQAQYASAQHQVAEDSYQVWRARFLVCRTGGLKLITGGCEVELITQHLQSQIKGRTVQRIV